MGSTKCLGVKETPLILRGVNMVPKGNPIPAKGERNIFCPFYNGCLDYAIKDLWDAWNCSQCHYRLITQSFNEHDHEGWEVDQGYNLEWDVPLDIDLFE
jgi:hypothetical protein